MKVLLISLNKEMFPPAFPLSLSYLESSLKEFGHEVLILDLLKEDDEKSEIKKSIDYFKPDVIGISIRNIDNTLKNVPKIYYQMYKEFIDFIKKNSSSIIILGGAGFSIFPKELLIYYEVMYGIVGEGEIPFLNFLNSIANNKPLNEIKGLMINEDGNIIYIPQELDYDFNNKKFPKRDKKYIDRYKPDGRLWLNIQSKRGCNQSCIYCVYPYLEGKCFRLRSPKDVGDEIEYLYRECNVEILSFVDGVFNYPLQHAIDICDEIISRKIKIEWNASFSPDFDLLNPELLSKLIESGCHAVDFGGTDTASEIMLKSMKKNYTKEDIIKSTKMVKSFGLKVIHSLLFGGPNETIETIRESLDLMEEIDPDGLWINLGLRIYPHTEIEKIALDQGVINLKEDLLMPKFYISNFLNEYQWRELINEYSKRHPQWAFTCLATNFSEWVTEIIKYAESVHGIE